MSTDPEVPFFLLLKKEYPWRDMMCRVMIAGGEAV